MKLNVERKVPRRWVLLDDYMTADGNQVRLYKLPGSFATLFPDGSIEYHQSDKNWRNEIGWRYGENLNIA